MRAPVITAAVVAAAVGLATAATAGVARAQPVMAHSQVLDGPGSGVSAVGGMSLARDGSGGVVYLKTVRGLPLVFVSRVIGGVFQVPVQVDAGLAGASSQPVLAAGTGGLLVVAFVNGGSLYEATVTSALLPIGGPVRLAPGASNPAIGVSLLGKVYLAFAAPGAGGHDVRCAYYYRGVWGIEPSPLDDSPSSNAGVGSRPPAVGVANDGVALVAWGENGQVYSRRVWGVSPSIVDQRVDVPSLSGWSEVDADEPAIGSGAGDSSYFTVAFREVLTDGFSDQSRVLSRRLVASNYQGVVAADGLTTPGPEGADRPNVVVGEYGSGFIAAQRNASQEVTGLRLGGNGAPGVLARLDTVQNTDEPAPAGASVGYRSGVLVWRQVPGAAGPAEVRMRYFDGSSWLGEQVLSDPVGGPVGGLEQGAAVVSADIAGDVAAAWVQNSGVGSELVVAQGYQPPSGFSLASSFAYSRSARVVLSWSPPRAAWGPLVYTVTLDGVAVQRTLAASIRVPSAPYALPLAQGLHTYQVTATNPVGLTRTTSPGRVFVDSVSPAVTVKVTGPLRVRTPVKVELHETDVVRPLTRAQASGVATSVLSFGDGARYETRRGHTHTYTRAERYRIVVVVSDRAGNVTRVVKQVKILPQSSKKPGTRPGPRHA